MSLIAGYKSPWKTEELEILEDAVRKFYDKEFLPHAARWDDQHMVDREAWNKAGEAGLLCASISEEYGGGGGTFAHEMVIVGEQYRAGLVGFGNSVHSVICAHYIQTYGTEEQKQKWLPKMATGEIVCAIAMTEPGAGSDLQGVKTSAKKSGNQYVINGQKTFITNGQHANLVIVVCKTDPDAPGAKGISLIMVETDEVEGFRRGRNLDKMGMWAQDTSELFFDDVKVPMANLLGEKENIGFSQLMFQLPKERLIIAVQACVTMEKAVELTVEYTKDRKAFGKTIFDFQNTQFKLAECKTEAAIGRVFVDQCAVKVLEGTLDVPTAAMAKMWTTEKQSQIVDACLQFFGGYGYMNEYPIARMYTDSRIQRIYGGSNEVMKMLIARSL